MGEHLVLGVDQFALPPNAEATAVGKPISGPSNSVVGGGSNGHEDEEMGENEPLVQIAECRICQDEDAVDNFEVPCVCSGSLKVIRFLQGLSKLGRFSTIVCYIQNMVCSSDK